VLVESSDELARVARGLRFAARAVVSRSRHRPRGERCGSGAAPLLPEYELRKRAFQAGGEAVSVHWLSSVIPSVETNPIVTSQFGSPFDHQTLDLVGWNEEDDFRLNFPNKVQFGKSCVNWQRDDGLHQVISGCSLAAAAIEIDVPDAFGISVASKVGIGVSSETGIDARHDLEIVVTCDVESGIVLALEIGVAGGVGLIVCRVSHRIITSRNLSLKKAEAHDVSGSLVNVLTIRINRFGKPRHPFAEGPDEGVMWNSSQNLESRLEKLFRTRE
jgi:hypothetical protein